MTDPSTPAPSEATQVAPNGDEATLAAESCVPSDEAVKANGRAWAAMAGDHDHPDLLREWTEDGRGPLTAAYAIDIPRIATEAAAEARAATLREMCDDEESVVVRVKRIDAQALVLGGLDYALAVSEGREQAGGSPMRLRVALRDALNAAHFNPEARDGRD